MLQWFAKLCKTYAYIIVKGSLIVNIGRGRERVTNSTVLERSSSIHRMFFVYLGPLIIHHLGGRGRWVGSKHLVLVKVKLT